MGQLEQEKLELTNILSDASSSSEDLVKAGRRLGQLVYELDIKSDFWLELSEFVQYFMFSI